MADDRTRAYLEDILQAIADVESCFVDYPNRFDIFENDMMRQCVVERKVEIMGEAINRIRHSAPEIDIPNARAIVDTRNRIIHAYDNVRPDFLWSLVLRHIPELKKDIIEICIGLESNS